jgi:hypothetical protein
MKPRYRRLAAIWLVLALLLAGIAVQRHIDRQSTRPPPREVGTGHAMFAFAEADLSRVEVLYRGLYAVLLRDADGAWLLHDATHRHGPDAPAPDAPHPAHVADPAAVAELTKQVDLLAGMRADQRVTPDRPLDAYGLDKPQALVLFLGHGAAGKSEPLLAELQVGDLLPTQFSYYAQVTGQRDLWLVPRYRIAILLQTVFGEARAPSLLPPDERPKQ